MSDYRFRVLALAAMLTAPASRAQTQIDLRTQTKSVDFSGALTTKSFRTGFTLPASCSTGEAFFHLGASPGANLYACVAPNVWAAQASGGLAGRPVGGTSPSAGQLLIYNSSSGQWEAKSLDTSSVAVSALSGSGTRFVTTTGITSGKCLQSLNGSVVETSAGCGSSGTGTGSSGGLFTNLDSTLNSSFAAGRPVVMSNSANDFRLGQVSGNGGFFMTADAGNFVTHAGESLKICLLL